MKFVSIPAVNETGNEHVLLVNPEQVVMLVKVQIRTGLTAQDGKTPIVKPGTGLMLSIGEVIPTNKSEKEIQEILEGKEDSSVITNDQ